MNMVSLIKKITFVCLAVLLNSIQLSAQKAKVVKPLPPVYLEANSKLSYTPDEQGNRIPDFSYCGYMAGEEAIPNVTIKVIVPVKTGDATVRIQSAIDYVATLTPNKDGFRGVILLEKGTYEVSGNLRIYTSGIVLRGSGMGEGETTILGKGDIRETLITVAGKNDKVLEAAVKIIDTYVPVNSSKVKVEANGHFKVGDKVMLHRPSTKEWIEKLGADHFGGGVTALGWKAGQRDIFWDRTIVAINDNEITLDAPITTALDANYGGAYLSKYSWNGRIAQVGVENLRLESTYDLNNPKDEDHRWGAISFENVTDAWARQIVFKHFAGSAVNFLETGKRITVEDCQSLAPISEIGGQRRFTFFTTGQQTLFQRLYSEFGYHDYALGFCAAGPNAFVQCEAHLPFSFSGTIDSWASGVLFDVVNIDGQALSYANRGQDGQGAGWTAANSVLWQCSASRVDCFQAPTAQNWAFGTWSQFTGNGYWDMSNEHINPRSLYYAQLKDRIGSKLGNRAILLPIPSEASSSPKVEVAMALTEQAKKPAQTLQEFIAQAKDREVIPTQASVPTIDQIGIKKVTVPAKAEALQITNGWLVRGKEVVIGRKQEVPWWSGSARPYGLENAKAHITRFVPGQKGKGLTDNLEELTDWMKTNNIKAIDHNYGLWYERRRDDHERIRRIDSDVWPPFYELPFARSGKETAYDGLSKYDLTKYNKWYWNRLKQYADLADQKGLLLIHQNYFQHNIIEAGAHYADFPWRPANNINNTGFPEPVPYAGDKRIFMAEQFYDVSNPVRREIHKAYIRKCLDNFKDNTGVIQLIGAEYTGPLHFVQFWIDVIKEWEKETGKKVIVGLSTTKDVQDAILADAERAPVVNLIDIRYWHFQANGNAYAPLGGQNLAPRQHARLLNPKKTSFEQVYRAVDEYRQKFPQKAVIYSADSFDVMGWAVFMAGGSLANIPFVDNQQFLQDAASMKSFGLIEKTPSQLALGNPEKGFIIYNEPQNTIKLDLTPYKSTFKVSYINPKTGQINKEEEKLKGGKIIQLKNKSSETEVIWLRKIS